MPCPGSLALEQGLPDTSSAHADEGTAAHFLASECLIRGRECVDYVGYAIIVTEHDCFWEKGIVLGEAARFEVTDDMANDVQVYVDEIRRAADGGHLAVEVRLEHSHVVGVENQFGTGDAVILKGNQLQVRDLKFGRGVKVEAENNEQLMLYALGALHEYELVADIDEVLLAIHQPRLDHLSEWTVSVAELRAFGERARQAAKMCLVNITARAENPDVALDLNPGPSQCRWCKAKATCPALRTEVIDAFEAIPEPDAAVPADALAEAMGKADLVEQWCKAVRAEVERRLLAGTPVAGYKLVQGKRGSRAWSDPVEAEVALKAIRLKVEEMYDLKLISPTTAEKLAKRLDDKGRPIIGPRQWPRLQGLITQSDGKPSVAPSTDPRPALEMAPVIDAFADLEEEALA
jgi:hypothetical protein